MTTASTTRTAPPRAAVVLAGGRSTRMGAPKAALPWHGSTLLRRVTGVTGRAVDGPVIVVRAPGQELPELDPHVRVHDDPVEGSGPMMGLAVGLAAAAPYSAVAFVCSTDLPFLHSAYVAAVLRGFDTPLEETGAAPDVVLPDVGGYPQPMAAGYRTALAPLVGRLLDQGRDRPAHLFCEVSVRHLDEAALLADAALAAVDPDLDSVLNVNGPEQYQQALARTVPDVRVETDDHDARRVRATTLAGAAALIGVDLDAAHVALNGEPVTPDPWLPLQRGDTVSFRSDPGPAHTGPTTTSPLAENADTRRQP